MLKYPCLVLDHDDTVVKSTPEIHFPAFKKVLSELRPNNKMTLNEFITFCFDPGFYALCHDILKFSDEETQYQYNYWNQYVKNHIPDFYEGFDHIIHTQKEAGGLVCVVSHSNSENIFRDYKERCGLVPDQVFGWELGEEKRKPHPFPLQNIMQTYHLTESELIVVDDLKPGYDMAKACGVEFACAGWSHSIPLISNYMKQNCNYYFDEVNKLEHFLFDN